MHYFSVKVLSDGKSDSATAKLKNYGNRVTESRRYAKIPVTELWKSWLCNRFSVK